MRVFQTLVAYSSLTSSPCFITKSSVEDPKKDSYRVPVTCSRDKECPVGTTCYRIYGDTGFCVLTIPGSEESKQELKKPEIKFELTEEDKKSYFEFTGRIYDDQEL